MDEDRQQTRRGGPVTERRRIPLGIRIKPDLRGELVARAGASGGSITQETEILIEQGLLTEKMLGGPRTAALLRQLGELVKFYQDDNAQDDAWLDDRRRMNFIVAGWKRHIESIKPKEDEAEREARREVLEMCRAELTEPGADPARTRKFRAIAALNAFNSALDPEERAEWDKLTQKENK